MLIPAAAALAAALAVQADGADRARAEQLARDGRAAEAIAAFEHIVEQNPTDAEARMWIARLDLRLGRPEHAQAEFRAVLRDHPADVDARIGLGAALTR